MRKAKIKREGVCKLTLEHGVFINAHILPKSLTKPSDLGSPLMQGTKGEGFKRRWSSWTDQDLVVRKGEDILARIDDAGIKELRHHKLIWSSWVFFKPHFETLSEIMPDHSIRKIRLRNSAALHLFALSILWRAAASNISEMSEINLSEQRLEDLRKIVSGEKAFLPNEFALNNHHPSVFA